MLKKLIFLTTFVLFAFCNLSAKQNLSDLFEIRRITTNFNGVASNGNSIIAYGTDGIILRSTDLGEKWEQIAVNDSFNILKVVNINQNYYGLIKNGIIYSNDDGETWSEFRTNEEIPDIFPHKNQLICVFKDKIQRYDENLNLVREHKIDLDSSYYKATIYKNTTISVAKAGNKLFYYSRNWKLASFNLETNVFKEIDLNEILPNNHWPLREKLFSNDSDRIFLITYDTLYEYRTEENRIEKVLKKPSVIKNDSQITYLAIKDQIYAIYPLAISVIDADSIYHSKSLDSLYFGLIDKQNKTFVNIKNPVNDRFIANLRINDLKLFSVEGKEIFVAVGDGRLIYISTDGGKNWELKSLLNEIGPIYTFGKYNAHLITEYGKFYFTKDGGVTWLPQSNFLPRKTSIFKDGRFFLDSLRGFFLKNEQIIKFSSPNFYYTLDGGNTILSNKINAFLDNSLRYSASYKRKVLLLSIGTYRKHKFTEILTFNDSLKQEDWILHTDTIWSEQPSILKQIQDSLWITYAFEYGDTLYGLSPVYLDTVFTGFDVYSSTDFFNTWKKIFFFPAPNEQFSNALQTKDTVLIHFSKTTESSYEFAICALYLQSHSFKKYNLSFDKYYAAFSEIFRYCNKYYIFGMPKDFDTTSVPVKQLLSISLDKDEITDYEEIDVPIRYNPLTFANGVLTQTLNTRFPEKDDSLLAFASLNNFKPNMPPTFLFFIPKPCGAVSSSPNEPTLDYDYLYVSKTYPNPSPTNSTINFRVYYDPKYEITDLNIVAYDVLGQKVAEGEAFEITPVNQYTAEVKWRTQNLSSGLYLILVKFRDASSVTYILTY
jgi:hypothetical protein